MGETPDAAEARKAVDEMEERIVDVPGARERGGHDDEKAPAEGHSADQEAEEPGSEPTG